MVVNGEAKKPWWIGFLPEGFVQVIGATLVIWQTVFARETNFQAFLPGLSLLLAGIAGTGFKLVIQRSEKK